MIDPQIKAHKIAEIAVAAWHRFGVSAHEEICVGVVAALALIARRDPDGPDPAKQILASNDEEIAQLLSEVWCMFAIVRPELAFRCGPFAEWLNAEPLDHTLVAGAAAVARDVIEAGMLSLTLECETSRKVDLLGFVYTLIRSHAGRKAHGEFYTPASVAESIAHASLAGLEPGQSICDPTAGTGGLLRAAAQALRAEGRDPHEFRWYGCDLLPVPVAGMAVNAHIWGLGPQVVIGCANVLAEPDWHVRAWREQRAAVEVHEARIQGARMLGAIRALDAADTAD